MKCDTEKTTNGDQCHRCFMEWVRGDDDGDEEQWLFPCKGCPIKHLRKNMIEKLEGHYCESCAKEYEEKLLAKMSES